jgi:uncharacterized protein YjiS (DUF1127 family)
MPPIAKPLFHQSPITPRWRGFAAGAARAVQRGLSAWRSRHDIATLARLDERMLADMGLTRSDIRDAVAQPLWRDPTAVLAQRRRERQAHDYRAIFAQLLRERDSHRAVN